MTPKRYFDQLQVAIAVMIMMTCSYVMWRSWTGRNQPQVTLTGSSVYVPGEPFLQMAAFEPARSQTTLVIFIRSTCTYCTASMDFYRRLSALKTHARLIVFTADSEVTIRDYMEQHELRIRDVVPLVTSAIRFPGTPALALLDSRGIVLNTWIGKLSPTEQSAVVGTLLTAP